MLRTTTDLTDADMEPVLTGYVLAGVGQIRKGLAPPLYRAGIVYRREPKGMEEWQLPAETYQRRFGDCVCPPAFRSGGADAVHSAKTWPSIERQSSAPPGTRHAS